MAGDIIIVAIINYIVIVHQQTSRLPF